MPIRPFLAGEAFEPEIIAEMSQALVAVCDALSLGRADDRRTRRVAKTIVELAQHGVSDAAVMAALTLEKFKAD